MMQPADSWTAMSTWLQGLGQPELPELPGRKHTAPPERRDAVLAAWEALNRRTSGTSAWLRAASKPHEAGR